jgi:hypothetical protein
MNTSHTIHLKAYDPDTSHNEETGETIDVYSLAKSLTLENYALCWKTSSTWVARATGKGSRSGWSYAPPTAPCSAW